MPFRVGQESGRRGWYVFVDRPKELRGRRGGKNVRRKAGETREEALKNALRIEATLMASPKISNFLLLRFRCIYGAM